jgi:hypothetical protein
MLDAMKDLFPFNGPLSFDALYVPQGAPSEYDKFTCRKRAVKHNRIATG